MKTVTVVIVLLAVCQHVYSIWGMSSSSYSRLKDMLGQMNGASPPPPSVMSPPPPPPEDVAGLPAPVPTTPGTSIFGQPKTVLINIPVTFKKSLGGFVAGPINGEGVMGMPAPAPPPPTLPTPSPPPPSPTPVPSPTPPSPTPPSPSPPTDGCLFGILTSKPELSMWAMLVQLSGRDADLSNPDSEITFFAPTNAAFTTSGVTNEQFMALMDQANLGVLQELVDLHIVEDMKILIMGTAQSVTVPNAQGSQLLITSTNGDGQVQVATSEQPAAAITEPNLEACEGVLHVIDRVLLV